jgi:hypothetical protein
LRVIFVPALLPVFAPHGRAQQTLGGVTGNVMDISEAFVSLAGCISRNGPRLGRVTWLLASFFGKDKNQITT